MTEKLIFGVCDKNVQYSERRAAYVVVIHNSKVAMVSTGQKHFLPGGGSMPDEQPEETVARELKEEPARGVRLLRKLGEATQYFYSSDDDQHYRMLAVFFAGEFTDEISTHVGVHQLDWVPLNGINDACFHECHAWAVRQA